jgi:hypothetical protein
MIHGANLTRIYTMKEQQVDAIGFKFIQQSVFNWYKLALKRRTTNLFRLDLLA